MADQRSYPQVDRRSGLSLKEFRRDYLLPRRPVVITDLTDGWAAREKWTWDFFKSRFGDRRMRVWGYDPVAEFTDGNYSFVAFGDFIDRMVAADFSTYPYYLRDDWRILREYPELQKDYTVAPHFFDWFRLLPSFLRMPYPRLFLGPKGAKTPVHVDVWKTHAWLAQLIGHKRWLLFPPDQVELLYGCKVRVDAPDHARFPRFRETTPVEAMIGPGDTIFAPSGWPHWVVSLDATLSITSNYMGPGCFGSSLASTLDTMVVGRARSATGRMWNRARKAA